MTSDHRIWPPEPVVSAVLFVVLLLSIVLAFGAIGALVLAVVLGTGVRILSMIWARDGEG